MLLDTTLNIPPEQIKHIHLMGICGTGVGALAGMLQSQGYTITGSDQHIYPPMSDFLKGLGIKVQMGYCPENLQKKPDLVIVGNVITSRNPEAEALAKLSIPYLSMPQALNHFFIRDKISLVVSGTHGKTTTSSMLATMLHFAEKDPSFMIGGIVQEFNCNFKIGHGKYFVVEGDEYDTAFFDKGPKFLHYKPNIVILTSIEFDHADIYNNLDEIKESFKKLVKIIPPDGRLIANFDDPMVKEIASNASCPIISYGTSQDLTWSLKDLEVSPGQTRFSAAKHNNAQEQYISRMPGRHNAMNSLAVIALFDHLGIPSQVSKDCLQKFSGVRRRQEVRGEVNGVTVIDDFAHHPTAVRETLEALHLAYKNRRLVAVFEPRTNSSRRKVFQEDYTKVFSHADRIIIKDPTPLTNIAPDEHFSASQLTSELKNQKMDAANFADTDEIIAHLAASSKTGDVIAIMSNGGFDNIHDKLIKKLQIAS